VGIKNPSWKIFQFARVFKKINPKAPLNFVVNPKKIQSPLEKFLDTPLPTPNQEYILSTKGVP